MRPEQLKAPDVERGGIAGLATLEVLATLEALATLKVLAKLEVLATSAVLVELGVMLGVLLPVVTDVVLTELCLSIRETSVIHFPVQDQECSSLPVRFSGVTLMFTNNNDWRHSSKYDYSGYDDEHHGPSPPWKSSPSRFWSGSR